MADLNNVSHDFPGGALIAHGQNFIGNKFGGSNTAAKVLAVNTNLGRYGSESTKFYAGTGGGVEERAQARKDVSGESTSGEEQAAFLAKEKSLMLDRLDSKFEQMRQVLGVDEANREIAKHMPTIQANIARIDASIARLRGETPSRSGGNPANDPLGIR
jgi:hypothetical protein